MLRGGDFKVCSISISGILLSRVTRTSEQGSTVVQNDTNRTRLSELLLEHTAEFKTQYFRIPSHSLLCSGFSP